MYNDSGAGPLLGGGGASAAALAATGLHLLAYVIVAFTLIIVGLIVVRSMRVELDTSVRTGMSGAESRRTTE